MFYGHRMSTSKDPRKTWLWLNSGSLGIPHCSRLKPHVHLVGGIPTPLKNMSSSIGLITFPINGKNKKCSKPPTSYSFFTIIWGMGHPIFRHTFCSGGATTMGITRWSASTPIPSCEPKWLWVKQWQVPLSKLVKLIFLLGCPIPNPQKLGKPKQCSWSHVYMIHYLYLCISIFIGRIW
jgi:hypothetical protein